MVITLKGIDITLDNTADIKAEENLIIEIFNVKFKGEINMKI